MTDSIPALIAEVRVNLDKLHRWTFGAEGEWTKEVAREFVMQAGDALKALVSLSALSGDDREALEAGYQSVRDSGVLTNDVHRNALIWRAVDPAIRAALAVRRPSPVTREALEEAIRSVTDYWPTPLGSDEVWQVASALSRFSLPEPAEDEWEERLAACPTHGTHCWSCSRHKERRVKAGPWVPVKGTERL